MEKSDFVHEKKFIKVVFMRYEILRHLYPDKIMSTKELREATGYEKGNFSKKLHNLKIQKLVEVSTEKTGIGRPPQLINLTDDGREILHKIIVLRSPLYSREQRPRLQKTSLMYQCLNLFAVRDLDLKKLAADEFQLLTQRYQFSLEPQFFPLFKRIIEDNANNAVRHTLLISLLNMIRSSDPETRIKIESELGDLILKLNNTSKESRILKVTEEITNELFDSKNRHIQLIQRYLSLIRQNSLQIGEVRALIMKNLSPEEKTELRIKLLQEYKEANPSIRDLIKVELSQLR